MSYKEHTRVVSLADGDNFGQGVLDSESPDALDAQGVASRVGLVQLAILASKSSNGLTISTLVLGPLALAVARRAGIGADLVGTRSALVALNASVDAGNRVPRHGQLLNADPATQAEVVQRHRAIIRGEFIARDLAIRERSRQALDTGGRRRGRLGRLRLLLGRRALLGEHTSLDGERSRGLRLRLASTGRSLTVSPQEVAVLDAFACLLLGDRGAIEDIARLRCTRDNRGDNVALCMAVAMSVVGVRGHKGPCRGERDRNAELHDVCNLLVSISQIPHRSSA